jgi:hypothetical protein
MAAPLPLRAASDRALVPPPYPPSWFDRLKARVETLPGSWWVYYAALEIVLWFAIGMAIYHTVRQLALVRRIYDEQTRINLYNLGPLYALSGLTARTAIGAGVIGYGAVLTGAQNINATVGVAFGALTSLVVLACFFLPLLGIHRRLAEEKVKLIQLVIQRVIVP